MVPDFYFSCLSILVGEPSPKKGERRALLRDLGCLESPSDPNHTWVNDPIILGSLTKLPNHFVKVMETPGAPGMRIGMTLRETGYACVGWRLPVKP